MTIDQDSVEITIEESKFEIDKCLAEIFPILEFVEEFIGGVIPSDSWQQSPFDTDDFISGKTVTKCSNTKNQIFTHIQGTREATIRLSSPIKDSNIAIEINRNELKKSLVCKLTYNHITISITQIQALDLPKNIFEGGVDALLPSQNIVLTTEKFHDVAIQNTDGDEVILTKTTSEDEKEVWVSIANTFKYISKGIGSPSIQSLVK